MVAMIVLPCTLFRARTIAASMAIDSPEAIDAAPARRPERSGAWQPGDFLVSRGTLAQTAGEESPSAPLQHKRTRPTRPSDKHAHCNERLERSTRKNQGEARAHDAALARQ